MYSSGFGALVLALQAAVVYSASSSCLISSGARHSRWIAFIPPLLYLAVYSKYRHYSAPLTGFALGVAVFWLWLRLSSKIPGWRVGSALALMACLYAAAPSGLLVFLPAALVSEIVSEKSSWKALSWLGLSAFLPWVVGALFGFAPGEAYAKLLPLAWDPIVLKMVGIWLVVGLYALPLLFCLGALGWRLIFAVKRKRTDAGSNDPGAPTANIDQAVESRSKGLVGTNSVAVLIAQTVGLAMLPWAVVLLGLNPQVKAFLTVDYLAWQGRWPEVLKAVKTPPRNPFIACTVTQAKYHTGTLTSQLPYLTSPAELLLFNDKQQAHWKRSDLYYDLGYLNLALHHLTEAMEFYGERPNLLQRLALVNLALTNISTAKVYLGTLARAPFQGRRAQDYLDCLEKDPSLGGDEEVSRLRRLMVRRDSVIILTPDEELLMLLGANRQNRMAFEYLMTYYLLTKNLQGFVKNFSRVNDFPGFEISPMWDEALLLASLEAGRPLEIPGHVISPEARSRVNAVNQVIKKNGENAELSRHELTADYAHTYSFYWWFHL
jgi:tetratricopeptide (TPR) repeat protein